MFVQFTLALFLLSCAFADEVSPAKPLTFQEIPRECFGCICEAASNCDVKSGCVGETCGPFRITWAYWADSGKPTQNGEPVTNPGAWTNCVNDPFCAARAVQGYMDRFAQDCNGDGVINCDDYVRLHYLGGYGCKGPLLPKYENNYNQCMSAVQSQKLK